MATAGGKFYQYIQCHAMTIFLKHFPSSVASSPLHRLVPANLSPPSIPDRAFLNLKPSKPSSFSTSIAAAGDNEPPFKDNPHTQHTTECQQQQNPVTQFLLNECGLSQPQLSTVIRDGASLFERRSTKTAEEAVQLFRDLGFTKDQVRAIIVRDPSVLCLEAELKPKIELLKTLGLTGKGLVGVCKERGLLSTSLKNLSLRVHYLQSLFASKDSLGMALIKAPALLHADVERIMKPNLDLLQQSGVKGELLSFLITLCPRILVQCTSSLKFNIEYVRNMGISPSSEAFAYAFLALYHNGPEIWKKKNQLSSFGFLQHEIEEHLSKCPAVFETSIDKMQKNMDFLIHTARLPANIVLRHPKLLTYSLEARIKPCHAVVEFMSAMQLYKSIPNLGYIIKLKEQEFLDKYVKDSPYATRLLEIYRGKIVDLDIVQGHLLQD